MLNPNAKLIPDPFPMNKILKYSFYSAVFYLIFLALFWFRVLGFLGWLDYAWITRLEIASLIPFPIFIWGFATLGKKYQIHLLVLSSYLLMGISLLKLFFLVFNLEITGGKLIMGSATVLFGSALPALKTQFGFLALASGIMEGLAGIFIFFWPSIMSSPIVDLITFTYGPLLLEFLITIIASILSSLLLLRAYRLTA